MKYYYLSTGQFGFPQPQNTYRTITFSAEEGCATCWIGHKQISEIFYKGEPKPKKNHFTGLNWIFDQVLVREIVKNLFEKNKISGVEFKSIFESKLKTPIPNFYQLQIDTILPPSLLNQNLAIEICEFPKDEKMVKFLTAINSDLINGPFCGKRKFNFPQGQKLIFNKKMFQNIPDAVRTNEWFGSGGVACRPILVSEKVKNIIIESGLKGAVLEDVELV